MADRFRMAGSGETGRLMFFCPGCAEPHGIRFEGPHKWEWNGNLELGSLAPSIKVMGDPLCHSFVKDGKIQYLTDSTHKFVGQTVDIPEWEEWRKRRDDG